MEALRQALDADEAVAADALAAALVPILTSPTAVSSAGFPFIDEQALSAFHDSVPHILGHGNAVVAALEVVSESVAAGEATSTGIESLERAAKVVRQVVNTAAITAPSDLWLLRHVLGTLAEVGVVARLLSGEVLQHEGCQVEVDGDLVPVQAGELRTDLGLLLARGYIEERGDGFVAATTPYAREVLVNASPLPAGLPADPTSEWLAVFSGEPVDAGRAEALCRLAAAAPELGGPGLTGWMAGWQEIELGWSMLPVVLAMRASGHTTTLADGGTLREQEIQPATVTVVTAAFEVLRRAGVVEPAADGGWRATSLGKRVCLRGPGPFGIIQAYQGFMSRLRDILVHGRGEVWVSRGANIAASQDANRATFVQANDALDRFCDEYGFSCRVFIEHALGRGEATRQRFERSGDAEIRYFGADLEDAAIDGAMEEQRAGCLPAGMVFVRNADIGEPQVLVAALREAGVEPRDAVMMVGNGFHEVRGQTDGRMVEVFQAYHDAGLVLLFTEASALSADDLLATGWNTFHAGFRYVHEKSGQGLRPAYPRPPASIGLPLRASWDECARKAGYVRVHALCSRSRTIYPSMPKSGHNPAISVNHFVVPADLARRLGVGDDPTA